MNYKYQAELHELWGSTPTPPSTQSFHFRRHKYPGIEGLLLIDNRRYMEAPTVVLPDLSAHLVVHFLAGNQVRSRLIGPRTHSIFFDRCQRRRTFIIRFQPQALAAHLPFPVAHLRDRSISAEALKGRFYQPDQLAALADAPAMQIFQFLMERFYTHADPEVYSIAPLAERFLQLQALENGPRNVKNSAKSIGVTERYLQRVIQDQVGLSPKTALRILRFRHSLLIKQHQPRSTWAAVANQSGYFDQSHMIDEYQRFLGNSPDRFFNE